MEIEATPWHETRIVIPPQLQMLSPDGMIQYKSSLLKKESPKTVTSQKRFIHFNANYVKYCFLKEFYQLLFDGVRQEKDIDKDLIALLADVATDFSEHCQQYPLEEDARELFRTFCKAHLF